MEAAAREEALRTTGAPKVTQEDMDLVREWIEHHGTAGITRERLSDSTGVPDRKVRECVAELVRTEQAPWIVSTSGDAGYRVSQDPDELRAAAAELRHRIGLEAARASALEAEAERLEEQRVGQRPEQGLLLPVAWI